MERRKNVGAAKSGSQDPVYDQLASMNMGDLEVVAREVGVSHASGMEKEELIAAIKLHTK